MKKIIGLFALLLALTGCDDGDMTFKSFNFSDTNSQSCSDNGLIFKIRGNEALLLQINPAAFVNVEGTRIVTIGGQNSVIYRTYTGPVGAGSICSDIPPASPSVIDEYVATPGGTLSIMTTAVRNDQNKITGYNHVITIVNATFSKEGESIIINNNSVGLYSTPVTHRFDFLDTAGTAILQRCEGTFNGRLYKINGDEALIINFAGQPLPTTEGTTTIDFAVETEPRELSFNEYSSTALLNVFCDAVPPITPVVTKQWEAYEGTMRIVTTIVGSAYEHVFILENVKFRNRLLLEEVFQIDNVTDGYRLGKLTVAI